MSGFHVPPLVWQIINFLVLFAILYTFLKKPLKAYLLNRHNAVKEKIEETNRLLAEAEMLKRTYEEKLAGLDQEITAFKNTVMAEAEQEKTKILAEASQFTLKIKEQARMTYEQEMKEIKNKIKEDVTQLTIENAEKLIIEKMSKADHEKLVEDFIVKLRSLN
ncbi:MAG TPA: ATP synthase F0 subunit B [Syntrophorhabdaceae bacterium]|nr:ATP synthase F0 subunit B [Syntrophorhabdaceae bacterium]